MKKVLATLLVVAMMLGIMGCQKTPESPIVVGKNNGMLIEKAAAETTVVANDDTLAKLLGAPSHVSTDFLGHSDSLHVHVDAEVVLPDVSTIPIYRVHAGSFSDSYADTFYQWFRGDTDMFIAGNGLTKPRLEQAIQEAKDFLASDSITDEERTNTESALAFMEKAYPNAPESDGDPLLHVVSQRQDIGNGMSNMFFAAAEHPGGEGKWFSLRGNRVTQDNSVRMMDGYLSAPISDATLYFSNGAPLDWNLRSVIDEKTVPEMPYSPPEAIQIVQRFLSDFGMNDFVISDVFVQMDSPEPTPDSRYGYNVVLSRIVDGIPVYSPPFYSVANPTQGGEGTVGAEWRYEKLDICLSQEGTIYSFDWSASLEIRQQEVEQAKLLPFDEIMRIFQKMVGVVYDPTVADHFNGKTISIDRVTFELQRICEYNSIEDGLLIPAWNFFGAIVEPQADGALPDYSSDAHSLLSINAIDGTIIDTRKGY